MNSTQWHILWTAALLPPQTMLPDEDFFKNTPQDSPLAATHLFGFPSPLIWEVIVTPRHEKHARTKEESNTATASPIAVEFAAFV